MVRLIDIIEEYIDLHSVNYLSDKCSVHRNTVGMWRLDKRRPTVDQLNIILKELGYDMFFVRGVVKRIIK